MVTVRKVGGLYPMVFVKLADSGQKHPCASAEVFAAARVVTISRKMELLWALCRGEVGVWGQWSLVSRYEDRGS